MKTDNTNYIGMKFGRWTIIGDYIRYKQYGHKNYLCKCSCEKGTEKYVDLQNLKSGKSISCGCLTIENAKKHFTKHGETKTRLFRIWSNMKNRCNNPNNPRFRSYGDRGIKVCEEWDNSYEVFRDWAISHGYDDNLTIDRIDNNGNYQPSNCRWVDNKTQCNNRRSNVVLEKDGIKKNTTEWGNEFGIDPRNIRNRLRRGITDDRLFSKDSLHKIHRIEYKGETHTLTEWSEITGINRATIWYRYKKGYPIDQVFYKGKLT